VFNHEYVPNSVTEKYISVAFVTAALEIQMWKQNYFYNYACQHYKA